MPNIPQYEQPGLGLVPTETGIQARIQSAYRGKALYNEAAQAIERTGQEIGSGIKSAGDAAVNYMDHQQINAGADHGASLFANLTQSWNQTSANADPHDPSVAQKWREEQLEPALQQFQQGFTTEKSQDWAARFANNMRTHMFAKTEADMSTLAGAAVKTTVGNLSNKFSNTAIVDPSAVPAMLDAVDHSIDGIISANPNLKGADAARVRLEIGEKIREQIVKSGAIGAIQKAADPEAEAIKWGQNYPDYISGAEVKTLGVMARQQIHADRIDRTYADHIEKVATQDRSDAAETGYMQKLYSNDPKTSAEVSTRDIVNDPMLTRTSKERLVNIVNREMKPETSAKISAQTSAQIFRQLRDPNADPQKINEMIFDARAKDPGTPGSLTKSDTQDLQKQLLDLKTPEGQERQTERNEFFKRYAATIDPSMGDVTSATYGHHTALGEQKMYEAEKAMGAAEKRLGVNWRNLYDPASPDFFGKPANLMKYQASMQEAAKYQAQLSSGGNLTGSGKSTTGEQIINIPAGMSPADAMKEYKSGQRIRLPDGRMGTVP